ncbi:MAG: hypothetical protein LPK13_00640, partial [Marinobacter sp.]|uniref:hypothetical protein n=1 Tax=Marinobacter sp. TaxID=50741 RepID=UPI0029C2750A
IRLGAGYEWVAPPKKRYEHIHVRFAPAIQGLRDFWKGYPTLTLSERKYRQLRIGNLGMEKSYYH